MFYYYGAKNQLAKHYATPTHNLIIEPFGGSAAYSIYQLKKNNSLKVLVNEKNPRVYKVWQMLMDSTVDDILNYPCPNVGDSTSDFFIITCSASNSSASCKSQKYTDRVHRVFEIQKKRVAGLLQYKKNIELCNIDYSDLSNEPATWFIDPPYQLHAKTNTIFQNGNGYGKNYNSDSIDFDSLGNWCKSRNGQVIVCEKDGANWLDFVKPKDAKTSLNTKYTEVVYYQ